MYAIIEESGVQYRVQEGDFIEIARLNKKPGETVTIDKVLLVADGDSVSIGKPILDKAKVTAEVVAHDRQKKIVVYKYKPKKSYARMLGHRQDYTSIKVTGISL